MRWRRRRATSPRGGKPARPGASYGFFAGGKVQRILCVAAAFLAAVLLLGGIYFGVRMLY